MNNVRRATAHTFLALLEAMLVASLLVVLVAGTTFAGKGGAGKPPRGSTGTGSVSLVLVIDMNGNGAANWGDTITYTVATTATQYPYVSTQCTQGSTLVLSDSAGWYASYAWPDARNLRLATDRWTGGAANCTARLYSMDGGSQSILKTITFSVGA